MDITIRPNLAYDKRIHTPSFKADERDDKKQTERKNPIDREMHNVANNPYYGYGGCCIPIVATLGMFTTIGAVASDYNPDTTVNQPTKEITANENTTDCDTLKNGSVVVTEGDASQDFEYIPADESPKSNTVDEPED